jgi:serine/threonine-protein kinase
MGKVHKGVMVDERTGTTRTVAIKFMFDDLPEQVIERAKREASIQLKNDNLIEMLAFLQTAEQDAMGNVKYHNHVVSELLDGVSLSSLLEGNVVGRDGKEVAFAAKLLQDYRNDPEHFARTVVMSVLSGLMALHDAGFIHRDIDPSNIMVTSSGHIKLIDFGIAKQMNNLTTGDRSLTVAGKFMGKPEYAAPELVLGDLKSQNQTTDIYAVGILLYQCIVGHTPFEGPRHEILEKQMKEKLPLDVVKNKALRGIIARACEKKQDLRYQSSAQMRVALETMNPDAGKGGLTKTMKMGLLAGAVALLLILIVVFVVVKNKQAAAQEQEEKARMEQLEARKTTFVEQLNTAISKADHIAANVDKETDDFENAFMDAYKAYAAVSEQLAADSVFGVQMPEVAQKMQAMKDSVQAAKGLIQDKVDELKELGLDESEETVQQLLSRLQKIDSFINN